VKVEIRPEQVTADRVTQALYHVSQREKMPLLLGLLRREAAAAPRGEPLRTLLFVNTKRFAERLVGTLERHGWKIGALTGDIPQPRRLKILADFKNGTLPLLVATDVASRGLHIEGVTHVINVDLPQDPEDYVHRIGRTARAGRTGKAISLADEDYVFSLDAIQRLIGMKIPVEFADDKLFAAPGAAPAAPKKVEEQKAAPPAPKISSKLEEKTAPAAPKIALRVEETAAPPAPPRLPAAPEPQRPLPIEPAAAAPPTFEESPSSPLSSLEESPSESPVSLLAADFWTREAFGLEAPEGGFGGEPTDFPLPGSPAGAPAKRRRRRRGRRVAPRAEAAAPA
jgi:ATP-dependent RNA helicase RhlB